MVRCQGRSVTSSGNTEGPTVGEPALRRQQRSCLCAVIWCLLLPDCNNPSCWVSFTNICWGCSTQLPFSMNKSPVRAAAWGATEEIKPWRLRLYALWDCFLSLWVNPSHSAGTGPVQEGAELSRSHPVLGPAVGAALGKRQGVSDCIGPAKPCPDPKNSP